MIKKLTAVLLMSIMVLSGTVMSFAEEIEPRGEADCPRGVHRMVRKGMGYITDIDGNMRYENFAVYQCSYRECGSWFVCSGDPVFYHTIGIYFVNPTQTFGWDSSFEFATDDWPEIQEETPLPGFLFYATKEALES